MASAPCGESAGDHTSQFRRGISISHIMAWAPVENAPSTRFLYPPFSYPIVRFTKELNELHRVGFDFVRFAVDPGPFLQWQGSTAGLPRSNADRECPADSVVRPLRYRRFSSERHESGLSRRENRGRRGGAVVQGICALAGAHGSRACGLEFPRRGARDHERTAAARDCLAADA